jgi:hypothetical protein
MSEKDKPIQSADDAMSRIAKAKKEETPEIETPVVETPEVEIPEVETPEIETPEIETPETETPEVETPETEEVENEFDEDGNLVNWDSEITTEETPEVETPVIPTVNYTDIGTDLGFENIANQEELKAAIETKIKAAKEEGNNILEGVPAKLIEAIDLAKQGADYVGYLSETEVDYSQFNNQELVALKLQKYFKNEDGTINDEKLQERIDAMDEVDVQLHADDVRQRLEAKQKERLETKKRNAVVFREKENQKATSTIAKLDSIANLKLKDTHKAEVLKVITSGNLSQTVFGENAKGELDYNKVAEIVFYSLYGKQIQNVNSQRVRNQSKREMLDSMSNKEKKGSQSRVNPATTKESPMDRMAAQYGVPKAT